MKTIIINSAWALSLLFTSCSTSINNDADIGSNKTFDIDLTPANIEYCEPPGAVMETIKAVPANINDDAIESSHEKIDLSKKKIIKDGEIEIKAKEISLSKRGIDSLVKKFVAYYEKEDHWNNENEIRYNLKIRIASDKFENFISLLESGTDEIISKSINARDVTEDYRDTEIQLANKERYMKRYLELLNVAKKVEDILSVQENIRVLEEEIDITKGHIKYLDDQITYSTLILHLFHEKDLSKPVDAEQSFLSKGKASFKGGWDSTITFVLWIFQKWPLLILFIVLFILVKRFIKRKYSTMKKS